MQQSEWMTAVSFRGDKIDKDALKALAVERGMSTGDFLRSIVEKSIGSELAEKRAKIEEARGIFSPSVESKISNRKGA